MSDPLSMLKPAGRAVLATVRRDGRPQLSNIAYCWDGTTVRISVTDDRAKTHNMRRDPRVALEVTTPDLGAYAVVEGSAELGDVAGDAHDAAVDELVEVYRAIAGEHGDWEDYRAAMVRDRRLVVRLRPSHAYGWAP